VVRDVLDHFKNSPHAFISSPSLKADKTKDKSNPDSTDQCLNTDVDNNTANSEDTLSVEEGNDSDFSNAENDDYEIDIKDKKKNSKDKDKENNINNNNNNLNLKTECLVKTEHILRHSRKDGITKEYLD